MNQKRLRAAIRILIPFLVLLVIVGLALLIINEKVSALDTAYEIIVLSVGMAGVILAIVSQLDTYEQESATKKMLDELAELNRSVDEDKKVDDEFQKRLDELLSEKAKTHGHTVKTRQK